MVDQGTLDLTRIIRGMWAARYGLAALLLLVVLIVGLGTFVVLIEGRSLQQVSRDQGLALTEALETSGRNALLANQRFEESIAQRLLDNARLLDRVIQDESLSNHLLTELAARNQLNRVEVLDAQGQVLATSAIAMPHRIHEHMASHGMEMRGVPPMMRHFYTPLLQGQAQEGLEGFGEQRFWLGQQYGVAIRRQAGTGLIAITADAREILKLRQEMGLQRLLDDLTTNPILAYVVLYNPAFMVVAQTPSAQLETTEVDAFLRQALTESRPRLRAVATADGSSVLEVVKPFHLGDASLGLLRVGLQTRHITELWQRSVVFLVVAGLGLLVVGGVGLHAVFQAQARHQQRVRALERRLARQERLAALGDVAAGVAHEVRNPLNAIGMGIQRLAWEFSPVEDQEGYRSLCQIIRGEVARLNTIVQDFLTLARAPTLQHESVGVETLLQEVRSLMEAEAKERSLVLTVQASASLPNLLLDRKQMKQALINLMLNAIQATPRGGTVQVTAALERNGVRITIIDSGPGIPSDMLDRIFDPYFTTKRDGTGLGLPIALRIIQAHGGTLDVSSVPGQGTTVEVRLPPGLHMPDQRAVIG